MYNCVHLFLHLLLNTRPQGSGRVPRPEVAGGTEPKGRQHTASTGHTKGAQRKQAGEDQHRIQKQRASITSACAGPSQHTHTRRSTRPRTQLLKTCPLYYRRRSVSRKLLELLESGLFPLSPVGSTKKARPNDGLQIALPRLHAPQ